MTYTVVLSPKARDQLLALDDYIAAATSPAIAARYTDAVADFCHSLGTFPQRGIHRDDIRPGLRITNYRKRTIIVFVIDANAQHVAIMGIFHGGQDYETELAGEPGAAEQRS